MQQISDSADANHQPRFPLPTPSGRQHLALLATPSSARGVVVPRNPHGEDHLIKEVITEAQACELLRIALHHAATRSAGSIRDLRHALQQFTVTFRDAGTTPEAVLIRLKQVIKDESLPSLIPLPLEHLSPIIREQMSTWCIEEYFRPKTV